MEQLTQNASKVLEKRYFMKDHSRDYHRGCASNVSPMKACGQRGKTKRPEKVRGKILWDDVKL